MTGNADEGRTDRGSPGSARRPAERTEGPEEPNAPPPGRAGFAAWTRRARRAVLLLASGALLAIVAAIAVVAPSRYGDLPPAAPPDPAAAPSPCVPPTDAELERLAGHRWSELRERLRHEPSPRTGQTLRDEVDAAFEPVYARIPGYLDWHYSFSGQYAQYAQIARVILDQLVESQIARAALGRLRNSDVAQAVLDRLRTSELAQTALDPLPDLQDVRTALDQLGQGVESRLFADLPDRIGRAAAHVETVMREELRADVEQWIRNEARALPARAHAGIGTPCAAAYERMLREAVPHTVRRFTDSAVPTGILAAAAGFRGAAAAGTLVKRLSGRLLSRTAASRTVSGTASRIAGGIGSATAGPAAAAAWLLVDAAVLFVDEHFNRDDLERELTGLVDRQKEEIAAELEKAAGETRSEALGEVTPSEIGSRN